MKPYHIYFIIEGT